MKVYLCSITALAKNGADTVVETTPVIVKCKDGEEESLEQHLLEEALLLWPEDNGWLGHTFSPLTRINYDKAMEIARLTRSS